MNGYGKGITEAESRAFKACQDKGFPGCFVKGTLVTTTFGPHPIDQIQVGDKVLAYDLKSGKWLPTPVLNTFQSDYRGFKTTIITADDHIESTYSHPFWVIRGKDLETRPLPEEMLELPRLISLPGRWVEAGHVQIGDQLLLMNGKEVSVEEVETVPYAEKVFNLEIAEIHTYAVGKTGVLVHNSNCVGAEVGNSNLKHGHHTIPKEIQKKIPPDIQKAKEICDKSEPQNLVQVDAKIHLNDIHSKKGISTKETGIFGGVYNLRFNEEIYLRGGYEEVNVEQIIEIRNLLIKEFGL